MTDLPLTLSAFRSVDAAAIERLEEHAFGPGRFARTAYRLREGRACDASLSFVAHVATMLVGSNRMTPVRCGAIDGLLLGPLVVEPAFRSKGIGAILIKASLEAASQAQHRLVILVGDEPYYKRFGFAIVPRDKLMMPGPVDPRRLLYRELAPNILAQAHGQITSG